MAHVSVTRNGNEAIFKNKPRMKEGYLSYSGEMILLPPGSIKKLTGKDLKFGDEPVELTDNYVENEHTRDKEES